MGITKNDRGRREHAYIPELKNLYAKRRISRRQFLRNATLLGMSVVGANAFLASCAPQAVPEPAATQAPAAPATPVPEPTAMPEAAGPVRGGTLRVGTNVMKAAHPAQISWAEPSNQLRQVAEYLTQTDGNNVTHPWLLEKWEASDDLLTWTLHLRQNILFNNGDPFVADDVVFTMSEWLNPDVGSSILGLMSYLSPENIEKVDDQTVKLHLDRPEIAVPEHMFHYPAMVVNHRTFEGDFIKAPHGTGAYTLEDYSEGERVLVKRRDDYWQNGADGDPLPYLDSIEFLDMGEEMSAWMAALQADEIDLLDLSDSGGPDIYLGLKDAEGVNLIGIPTAQTRVLRMRVDMEPWSDNRVRTALKLCQNREKILNLAYFGEGLQANDYHVYPQHPEYCEMPLVEYQPEKAKQLLEEAGYPDGLEVNLAIGTGWPDVVSYAEVLKEDAAAAGFNINVNTMPNSQYWEQWTEVDLGITPWTHRPLGTMVLNLAYIADENGEPVPWNETRWVDDEFNDMVQQANGTLDVEKRREIFCELQQIMQDRGPIGIAYWRNTWAAYRDKVQGVKPHPTHYLFANEIWKEA